jgi:dihydropyrimidine dehydrogenase (NAD+) subunit PreA
MQKRPGSALHSSWNWELISDKALDWWLPRLRRIKEAHPDKILIASIMAGSGSDRELQHWQTLATACQDAGADAFELNLSCPHMDRKDMGSNIGQDEGLISIVTQVGQGGRARPGVVQADALDDRHRRGGARVAGGGADAIVSSNTFPSLPLIDPLTLEFEVNVDGYVSSGGLGGPAILPHVAREDRADDERRSPTRVLGHRRDRRVRARAELLPARLRHGAGLHRRDAGPRDRPNVIQRLKADMRGVPRAARRQGMDAARGLPRARRDRVVAHSRIRRPDAKEYFGGHETPEGYAARVIAAAPTSRPSSRS